MKKPIRQDINRLSLFMAALWLGIAVLLTVTVSVAVVNSKVFNLRSDAYYKNSYPSLVSPYPTSITKTSPYPRR